MSIRNLNKASRDYLNGNLNKAELLEFWRIAAYASYASASASDSDSYAYAAYASAASASDSDSYSYASSAYASYASASASDSDSAKFKESVKAYVFTKIKTIK